MKIEIHVFQMDQRALAKSPTWILTTQHGVIGRDDRTSGEYLSRLTIGRKRTPEQKDSPRLGRIVPLGVIIEFRYSSSGNNTVEVLLQIRELSRGLHEGVQEIGTRYFSLRAVAKHVGIPRNWVCSTQMVEPRSQRAASERSEVGTSQLDSSFRIRLWPCSCLFLSQCTSLVKERWEILLQGR